MNEKLLEYKNKIVEFWNARTPVQKGLMIFSIVALFALSVLGMTIASNPKLVPLYSNLSPAETGQIKQTLDARGIPSEITDNGTVIRVPQASVDTLKVELAAEGIPKSGSIDYSFFSQNAGFGMTDNEFNVLKLDAMQTELSSLITSVDGINDAKVMITLPEKSIWVGEEDQMASASVVLNTVAGFGFDQNQVQQLYHLISKSVPNLPTNNIVITNQFFEVFDLKNNNVNNGMGTFVEQNAIKKQIERDIQIEVQKMLGTLMGRDKVVVSVTADIDFTQENQLINKVEPVSEDIESLAVSAERITETFTGNGDAAGGVVGTGDSDVPNYEEVSGSGENGEYERTEERLNNEFNRIKSEVRKSPFQIRDLGIQVMVEPPVPDDPTSLPEERVNDIEQILSTIVQTSISKEANAYTQEEIANKIVVSVQPFNGKVQFEAPEPVQEIPTWYYIVGGVLVVIIGLLIFLLIRKNRKAKEEEFAALELTEQQSEDVPEIEESYSESDIRRKQLEKIAQEKPEDFAKLLRTWLADE